MTEAPSAETTGKKRRSPALTFIVGIIAGLFLAAAARFLYCGYFMITLPGPHVITVKLPYYEALHEYRSRRGIDRIELERKLKEVGAYVDGSYLYYIDNPKINDGMFAGIAYVGMGEDRYAAYYDRDSYVEVMKSNMGSYCGIGITAAENEETGGVDVVGIREDGSAKENGLEIGDIIIKADGHDLRGVSLDEAVSFITGEEGTFVQLTVRRGDTEFEVSLERRSLKTTAVRAKYLDNDHAYMSISSFTVNAGKEFINLIGQLENAGVRGVIFDLRNNRGGDMNVCLDMLDRILPDKDENGDKRTLLTVEAKDGTGMGYFCQDGKQSDFNMVVLVNEDSASASEIFAGVLQDYGRKVIGKKTFGKGIVQSTYLLADGSALKLTTHNYILPDGELIHGTGISPDVEVDFKEFDEVQASMVNFAAGSETDLDKDNQISAALRLLLEEEKDR